MLRSRARRPAQKQDAAERRLLEHTRLGPFEGIYDVLTNSSRSPCLCERAHVDPLIEALAARAWPHPTPGETIRRSEQSNLRVGNGVTSDKLAVLPDQTWRRVRNTTSQSASTLGGVPSHQPT